MRIAVIIPSRDPETSPLLQWTLDGYAQQQLTGHTLEVGVGIDGGASPGSSIPAPISSISSAIPIHITRFPRLGAAAIRNRLVGQTTADLLIFGNSDARPAADMVQQHADLMPTLSPNSLILGNAPWEKPSPPACPTVFDALLAETPMIFFYNQLVAGQWYDFRHAWTLNLSVRTEDFHAAGGFPELLRPVYYEDLAFGHRVMRDACKKSILYHPAAKVIHRHPTTLDQYLDREELLGLMAPVLTKVAPETFAALHPDATLETLAARYEIWTTMDQPMHRYIYARLKEWSTQPESILPPAPAIRSQTLTSLYQMHIPLKRLAFRLGFLKGLQLADDIHWLERKPQSLWRAVAGSAI